MSEKGKAPAATGAIGKLQLPYVIASWPKGRGNTVKIMLDHFAGKTRLDMREWFFNAKGEEKPGKGLSILATDIPQLAKAIEEVTHVAIANGLLE